MTEALDSPASILFNGATKWLALENDLLPSAVLASVLANRIPGPPVWLMIVAPPSSAKSELIVAASTVQGAHPLSSVTAHTFASGLRTEPGQTKGYSLLTRLKDKNEWLLTVKDLGTILSAQAPVRNHIFGQLREIFDGAYRAEYGSGVEVAWTGKVGLIAGATPQVDRQHRLNSELGERFVQLRPSAPERDGVSQQALDALQAEVESDRNLLQQTELGEAFQHAFKAASELMDVVASLSESSAELVKALADFVSVARTSVNRNRGNPSLYEVSEPEGTGRLTKTFGQLTRGAIICYGGDTRRAHRLVTRIGIDSMPGKRRKALLLLATNPDGVTAAGVNRSMGCDTETARRELEDLVAIGLAEQHRPISQFIYSASEKLRDFGLRLTTESEGPNDALKKLFTDFSSCLHGYRERDARIYSAR